MAKHLIGNVKGPKGEDGRTPVKGVDYWTEEDKQEIIDAVLAALSTGGDADAEYTLTSADMSVGTVNGDGSVGAGTNRMYTTEPISLSDGTVSIDIAAPYQWLCYYSSQPYFDSSSFIGKTSFGGDSIDDVLTATLSQGTVEGAKYIRISLRDSTNTNADLTGRIDEFMSAITITVTPNTSS